jgi:hypothetical protein
MSIEPLREGWSPISTAPRDGTPVILWMIGDATPPEIPEPVGFGRCIPRLVSVIGGSSVIPRAFARTGRSAAGDGFSANVEQALDARGVPVAAAG